MSGFGHHDAAENPLELARVTDLDSVHWQSIRPIATWPRPASTGRGPL